MPHFTILGQFEREAIPDAVPTDYRGLVRYATTPGAPYTVILFKHDRANGSVNTSGLVRRALRQVPTGERVLAVGTDFTREATEVLSTRGAAIARIGEFGWTDASYLSLR